MNFERNYRNYIHNKKLQFKTVKQFNYRNIENIALQ